MSKREGPSLGSTTLLKKGRSEPIDQSDPWDSFVPKITVQNLVYTCLLGGSGGDDSNILLNLRDVCIKLKGSAGFNPKRFAAVVQRFRNPKIAVLLFSTGKIVCTGAKTTFQAQYIIHGVVENLVKMGYENATIKEINIENMVCSARLPTMIDRSALALKRPSECNYDVEQFPGVIMRHQPIEPITILVFQSGKIVLTGARTETKALQAFEKVVTILRNFAVYPVKQETTDIQPRRSDAFRRPVSAINNMAFSIEQKSKHTTSNGIETKKIIAKEKPAGNIQIEEQPDVLEAPHDAPPLGCISIENVHSNLYDSSYGACIGCETPCAEIALNDEDDLFGTFCCICDYENLTASPCIVCARKKQAEK